MTHAFCMIMAIMFWVLSALGIVSMMAWVYCQVQYYKWAKEDRNREGLVAEIQKSIVEAMQDSGGNCEVKN